MDDLQARAAEVSAFALHDDHGRAVQGRAAARVAKPQAMNDAESIGVGRSNDDLGVILVDHGSRREESNALLLDVVQHFAEATGLPIVEPAHMELAEPSIATAFVAVRRARCDHGRRVSVLSCCRAGTGTTTSRSLAAAAARQHPGVRYLVTAPFGLHPLMAEVMRQRIEHCLRTCAGRAEACELCAGTDRCQLRVGEA